MSQQSDEGARLAKILADINRENASIPLKPERLDLITNTLHVIAKCGEMSEQQREEYQLTTDLAGPAAWLLKMGVQKRSYFNWDGDLVVFFAPDGEKAKGEPSIDPRIAGALKKKK